MIRNRKILFQIGILIALVFSFVIVVSSIYVSKQSTEMYLSAKNEMINKDIDRTEKDISQYIRAYTVKYWVSHPDAMEGRFDEEEYEKIADLFASAAGGCITNEKFESLDDDIKGFYVKYQKMTVQATLSSAAYSNGYDDVYCLVPMENGKAFIIADDYYYQYIYSSEDGSDGSRGALEAKSKSYHRFGDIIDFDVNDVEGLKDVIEKKADKTVFKKSVRDDNADYVGYQPFYDENGDFLMIFVAEYDWSSVYSDLMKKNQRTFSLNMIIGLILTATIILICLYFVAVKPLKRVGKAVDTYMESKDSSDVEESLNSLKSRNEIGVLANNIKDMAKEIDQYTADIVSFTAEKAKVKTELDLAASIQTRSLINEFPESDSFDVYATMTPAKEVGGDFYDVFNIDEDRVGFVIADVSGKGMPAALMMMASMTSIRNYAMAGGKPSEILAQVNESMVMRDVADMFVTVWIGILDKKTGILYSGNAGHEYPAYKTDGEFVLIKERHSPVIGAMSGIKYRDKEDQLKAGDCIFVYTDGVPEANNSDTKMLGEERMLEALNQNPNASPEEILSNVKTAVDDFVGDAEQFDDLTMLCIRYNG